MEAFVIGRIDFKKSAGVSLHLWKVPMGPGITTQGNLSSVLLCCHTHSELCGLMNTVHGWLEDPLPFCSQLAPSAHFSQLSGESPFA